MNAPSAQRLVRFKTAFPVSSISLNKLQCFIQGGDFVIYRTIVTCF